MAFQKAAGYNNLPNGVFSPVIYSQKVQKQFRKDSVVEDITNTDYFGEIANFGDSVKIMKEPEITVRPYARGTQITPQDIEDSDFTMIIDKANYFAFRSDDIEEKHSHVNFMDLATDRASYVLAQEFDSEVLGYLSGYEKVNGVWQARTAPNGTKSEASADADELLAAHKLDAGNFGGTAGQAISMGVSGTFDATPLAILNRMNRILDLKNVSKDGRWVVLDPVFIEKLMDEDSKFMNHDYQGSEDLTNGRLSANKIRGFRVYNSNNLPFFGDGSGATDPGSTTDYGVIIAGHDSAVSTAQQINKTEKLRDQGSFGDIMRGMQLYGRKILRSEGLVRAVYNINA